MELKGKHLYGLGAVLVGFAAIAFGLVYWFINQKLDTTAQVSFAIGLMGLALFGWLEIDLLTRALNTRQARYGAETGVMILAFLGVVVLLNYIFTQDRLKKRWDLTQAKEHTLAPETLKVLSELKEPVKVIGFYTSQAYGYDTAKSLLEDFKTNSGGKLDFEFIDPQVRPTVAQQYNITRDATMIVERGAQTEAVDFANEESLANAIVRLNNPTVRAVYFIGGHGERSVDDSGDTGLSQLKKDLEAVNYQVKTLEVITATLPSDAAAIVIAGPTHPYADAEVKTIGDYLAAGGKAVVMVEPSVLMGLKAGQSDPLANYLSQTWGLTLRDDIVIDPVQYIAQFGPTVPATTTYGVSTITDNLKGLFTFFPSSRSIDIADASTAPGGVTDSALIKSGPDAWGETNFDSISSGKPEKDAKDVSGDLALAATADNAATHGRIVLFGDSEFGMNGFARGGNGTLLLNAIKWATASDNLIGLTPKPSISRSLSMFTIKDTAIVFLLGCVLPPLFVLVAAVAMWWSRRQHA